MSDVLWFMFLKDLPWLLGGKWVVLEGRWGSQDTGRPGSRPGKTRGEQTWGEEVRMGPNLEVRPLG